MAGKFKFIFIIIFLVAFSTIAQETQKKLAVYFVDYPDKNNKNVLCTLYLINSIEQFFDNKDIQVNNIVKDISNQTVKEVAKHAFSNGFNGFYYIKLKEDDYDNIIQVVLYDSLGNELYKNEFKFSRYFEIEKFINEVDIDKWIEIFTVSEILIKPGSIKLNLDYIKEKGKIKIRHDFPLFNLSVNAISAKVYFDNRGDEFSVFPVNIFLTFYPVKYLEAGLFLRFDYNNMVYKYYDHAAKKYAYYSSGFNFFYGFYAGLSFFYEKLHYSIGFSFYNMLYLIDEGYGWSKTNDVNSYFLPQFALYQKLDFKLFKFFSYSVFVNIKTVPMFTLKDNYFYSGPFNYDFVILEVSLLGFSITL